MKRVRRLNTYVPEFSAVSRFSGIVVSLAVSTEIQDLVLDTIFSILVQFANIMFESLPRCCFINVFEGYIRGV
jgi:hypothetical protein